LWEANQTVLIAVVAPNGLKIKANSNIEIFVVDKKKNGSTKLTKLLSQRVVAPWD
jgi:hypothetical protein